MSGQKIRMEMREENMPDIQPEFLRIHNVLMNVSLRIHNHGCPTALIA
jgi:hypothetical protein